MIRQGLGAVLRGLVVGAGLLALTANARADDANKTLKIGVVYDLTGPFAGGGSELHYLGAKTMIDWFIAHGGVEGYKIQAVYADAQSKPDVAINEAVRLIEQEKVDMLLGFYSSAECVPAAARIEEFKKFMWITTCIASPVLRDRHLKYVFRPQPYGTQWGLASTDMLAAYSKAQLGKDPKDLRVAIIHEDGPYGDRCRQGQCRGCDEGWHPGRGQRGLFGHRAGPVIAGHQAEARAAGRDPAHRLQSRHQPVPAPGARTGTALRCADRSRRRIHRLHRDQTGCRHRRQLLLRRRSDLDLGHQPEVAEARAATADPDDR